MKTLIYIVGRIKMSLTEMVRLSQIWREMMNPILGLWNLRMKVG